MSLKNQTSFGAFETVLKADQARVEACLRDLLAPLKIPDTLLDALHYGALSGGKRLRPFLAFEVARFLGQPADAVLPIAVALECVHCYSLIHDDLPCMDDASLRRGLPTVHKKFGQAVALLAGNSLLTLGIELLTRAPFDPTVQVALIQRLTHAAGGEGMMAGQHLDLLGEVAALSLPEITHMQSLKTGALIEAALLMPCDVFGASPAVKKALSTYGQCIGLAFQVQDDLLDAQNAPQVTGKDGNHDGQKSTFVSLLGLETARSEGRRLVDKALAALRPLQGDATCLAQAAQYMMDRHK